MQLLLVLGAKTLSTSVTVLALNYSRTRFAPHLFVLWLVFTDLWRIGVTGKGVTAVIPGCAFKAALYCATKRHVLQQVDWPQRSFSIFYRQCLSLFFCSSLFVLASTLLISKLPHNLLDVMWLASARYVMNIVGYVVFVFLFFLLDTSPLIL